MALNENEYELVTFIEQEYMLNGFVPSKERCLEVIGCAARWYDKLTKRDDFNNAMLSRNIPFGKIKSNGVLTAEQLMCINTLLDQNDNRSDKKKLADMDIATSKYQAWCRDPAFQAYLQQRTEALFPDGLNEANRALVDNVKRGDMGAIKLIYEMTGRWSSKPVSEMNIEWVLMKVLETLQKHITDPLILSAVAEDLTGIQQEAVPTAARLAPALPSLSGVPGRSDAQTFAL